MLPPQYLVFGPPQVGGVRLTPPVQDQYPLGIFNEGYQPGSNTGRIFLKPNP